MPRPNIHQKLLTELDCHFCKVPFSFRKSSDMLSIYAYSSSKSFKASTCSRATARPAKGLPRLSCEAPVRRITCPANFSRRSLIMALVACSVCVSRKSLMVGACAMFESSSSGSSSLKRLRAAFLSFRPAVPRARVSAMKSSSPSAQFRPGIPIQRPILNISCFPCNKHKIHLGHFINTHFC